MPAVGLPLPLTENSRPDGRGLELTLLELVWAISQVTDDEREVIATVVALLESGRVRLRGNFRGLRRFSV